MNIRHRMAGLSLLVALFAGKVGAQARPTDTLTNKAVIDMVVSKLPKELITQKIKTTPASFDVSAAGLVALNTAKVSKDLIKLMMDFPEGSLTPRPEPVAAATPQQASASPVAPPPPAKAPTPAPAPPPPPPPPPARVPKPALRVLPAEAGIHLRGRDAPMTILEPNTYAGESNAGSLGSTLSLGISKAKIKAHLVSPTAAIRTNDASAEFYFVFSLTHSRDSWSKGLTSPNQFALIRLDRKSDHRELTIVSAGTGGMQTGVDDKAAVPIRITRIKPGVYLVISTAPLAPGEYAFLPLGGEGQSSDIYDFGVDK